jgi:protein involved in polysaccharide export with SLBB domain
VFGDVRSPGVYLTSGDIHLSDAIHLAGGLAADADTEDVQVFRYLPDSSLKIFSVKLGSALEGSPTDNIVLNARDRILVHQNSAATDPATVYVKGDVARPGRYPLAGNMRVSDLLRAAGGLEQSADPSVADLTRYEWNGEKQIIGKQEQIQLAALLSNAAVSDGETNLALRNGDVLAIRQKPGWNDLGASITLRGEVVHPGTYGIRPGEKLSSVVRRAGGFSPTAYPYGSVLTRLDVRQIEEKSYAATIQRVREQQTAIKLAAAATSDPDEKTSDESAYVQWQSTLDSLINNPPSGRVAIQISSNLKNWADSNRDLTVRSGDMLTVPKRPSFVVVQGQVYGPTAIAYRPGKSARWYLMRGGGPTNLANKGAIFVIRADGTIIGGHSYLWSEQLNATLQPGDMVVVPEKALGGPRIWKVILQNAQILSSITTSAILATSF